MTKWLKKLWFKLTYDEIAIKCRRPLGKSLFIILLMSGICSAQTSILTYDANGVTRLHARLNRPTPDINPPPVNPPIIAYIGVPTPDWDGVNPLTLTYRMYDSEANQAPGLTYRESPSGGYYTHFVYYGDPDHVETDSGNTYGTVDNPRKTLPTSVPAGSIVEVHGDYAIGGAPYTDYRNWTNAFGNVDYPCFIRGVDTPKLTGLQVKISATYAFYEGFEMVDSLFDYNQLFTPNVHDHIVIRDNEIHHSDDGGGSMIGIKGATDCIVYNNYIHHNGLLPYLAGSDCHGISVSGPTLSQRIWIIDNEICYNDGDSVQINGDYANDTRPNYVYVAGNKLYADRENAIDIKDSNNVVISQNDIYGYTTGYRVFGSDPNARLVHGSDGTAVLPSNEGGVLTWVLFNDIHDCNVAIRVDNDVATVNPVVNIIGNVIHNISNDAIVQWNVAGGNTTMRIITNIIYNIGAAIRTGHAIGDEGTLVEVYSNIISNVVGWSSGDYFVGIGRDSVADNSTMESNVFYSGGGFRWGILVFYDTLAQLVAGESGKGLYCVESDPLFTDPANNDFSLSSESPVLDILPSTGARNLMDYFFSLYNCEITPFAEELFTKGTNYAGDTD